MPLQVFYLQGLFYGAEGGGVSPLTTLEACMMFEVHRPHSLLGVHLNSNVSKLESIDD